MFSIFRNIFTLKYEASATSAFLKIGCTTLVILEVRQLCIALHKVYRDYCHEKNRIRTICTLFPVEESSAARKLVKLLTHSDANDKIMQDNLWNTVLFFPDMFPDDEDSTTNKVIWYLMQAKKTLQICLFSLTLGKLERAIREINKRVTVEAIVHNPRSGKSLARRGINVKIWKQRIRSPYDPRVFIDLMHHKFFIIDGKAVATGSLNCTREAISRNQENLLITTNERSVSLFSAEFRRLWIDSEYT